MRSSRPSVASHSKEGPDLASELAGARTHLERARDLSAATYGPSSVLSAHARLALGVVDAGNDRRHVAAVGEGGFGYVFMAEETYDPPTSPLDAKGQGIPYAVYGYGAQLIELKLHQASHIDATGVRWVRREHARLEHTQRRDSEPLGTD